MRKLTRRLALCMFVAAGQAALAADPGIRLDNWSASAVRGPTDPFVFSWSAATPAMRPDQLAFELDGMDVTAIVQHEEGGARLQMPQNLARGEHRLRVVFSPGDGSLVKVGNWLFVVGGVAELKAAAATTLTLNQRLLNKGSLTADPPGALQLEGAAAVRIERESDHSQADLNAQIWLNSNPAAGVTDRRLDVAEYLLRYQQGGIALQAGHHQLPYESLIHSSFQRRGLSASMDLSPTSKLSGFAMRSEPVLGVDNFSGVNDGGHRVQGMVLGHEVYADGDSGMSVSLGALSGEGSDVGSVLDASGEQHRGNAWSLVGDAHWFGSRLRLRTEYAASRYDWDAANAANPGRENDHAYALLVSANSGAQSPDTLYWSVDTEHRLVGTFFRSVANLGLPSDKSINRLGGTARLNAWQVDASWIRYLTNANRLPTLATITADQNNLSLAWTPTHPDSLPWYGQPSVQWNYAGVRQRQTSTPQGFIGSAIDDSSWQLMMNGSLSHEAWNAYGSVGVGGFKDYAGLAPTTRSRNLNLGASWRIGEFLTLGPTLEWSRLSEPATGLRERAHGVGVFVDFSILPERLMGNFNLGVNRIRRSDDSLRDTNVFATGELLWRLRKASVNTAGFDLRLSLTRQDRTDSTSPITTGKGHLVFLGLTMTLPVATPNGGTP
jgi:hypothetical protein